MQAAGGGKLVTDFLPGGMIMSGRRMQLTKRMTQLYTKPWFGINVKKCFEETSAESYYRSLNDLFDLESARTTSAVFASSVDIPYPCLEVLARDWIMKRFY